jgi:hypothetical protein
MASVNAERDLTGLLKRRENLDALDRVDAEIRLHVGVEVQHLPWIARTLLDQFQESFFEIESRRRF